MEKNFWLQRWEREEIGFHQEEINPYLIQYWPKTNARSSDPVFVPLCGKSRDMLWLKEQGHRVTGVELSPLAVSDFYRENGIEPVRSVSGKFECCEAQGMRILCGDFFDLSGKDLADVRAVYDRASLIALPPDMRGRYADHLAAILAPGSKVLLVTMDYPQHEMTGPPFAVSEAEVDALYGRHAEVELLERIDVLERNPRFKARGLTRMQEKIFLLTMKG